MLKQTFTELLHRYNTNDVLIDILWNELESSYSHKKRYYHTFTHLENLLSELLEVKDFIQNWDAVLFALFYHDVVYNILKKDNEEQSAILARKRLQELNVPLDIITRSAAHIEATKSHATSIDSDTNLFTDADLSVLGKDWAVYHAYTTHIRNEYSFYPDLLYKPGRKMVLNHFLNMDRIFKTELFYKAYEAQARMNLKRELEEL